jgi:hypothetical protein
MSSTLSGEERVVPLAAAGRFWIASPAFDLLFFILTPLVTAPIVAGVKFRIAALVAFGFVLAIPHYLSTASFLMWRENAAYQRSRWLAYIAGPLVLAAVYAVLVIAHVPVVMQLALFVWTVFHVARQNCGILGIYRHRAGITDPEQKRVANFAIMATSVWMSLWFVDTHTDLHPLMTRIDPRLGQWLWIAAGSVAAIAIVRLCASLAARARRRELTSFPELAFLGMSLIMFAPYALIRDINVATFVMLLPHYVQYLGIVWLMNRRRAVAEPVIAEPIGEPGHRDTLRTVSASLPLLLLTLLVIGVAGTAAFLWGQAHQATLFTAIFTLVAFEHYYLDGLVWAFKRPHIRQTMGPWLAAPKDLAA